MESIERLRARLRRREEMEARMTDAEADLLAFFDGTVEDRAQALMEFLYADYKAFTAKHHAYASISYGVMLWRAEALGERLLENDGSS